MKEFKNIILLTRNSLSNMSRSILFYFVLGGMFLIIQFLCPNVGTYLKETDGSMNLFEIYIWFMARRTSQVIYLLGLIFLLGVTTFFHSGVSYCLIRTNRKNWVLSQILYLIVLVVVFNIFLIISFVVACHGAVNLCGQWSDAAFMAVQYWTEEIGIISVIGADYGFLKHNPNFLGGMSFVLEVLIGTITGLILYIFQMKGKMPYGITVVSVLWFLEVMLERYVWLPWLAYLTPYRLSRLGQLSLNFEGPSVIYAICYLILFILILETILTRISKTIDFKNME